MEATEFIETFSSSVNRQVARRKEGNLVYSPFKPSPVEWRTFWVTVFKELCEPLYRVVALPNTEVTPGIRSHHRFFPQAINRLRSSRSRASV